ncbi:MAG: aminomethyl-transferring glycine dehydrogenase subunit GcvPB [Chloroflexia bacterium]|nr:aminomethyl-transferring glycine dehydrogenase subunit GcvPB [Chloroflexia bacterium]
MTEPLIYELSASGRCGALLPAVGVPPSEIPAQFLRQELPLPQVSENDVVRHFVRLSQKNYAIDIGFYPLGSCTMKYNPKVNDVAAALPGLLWTHPYQPVYTVQGNLRLMWYLQEFLQEIGGFAAVSLQPAAGAHGEFTGIQMMRAYHLQRGDHQRKVVLIPDSAHGTNPATSAMSGYEVLEVGSDERGNVDLADLRAKCDDRVVGLMLTNPNTLGLFEEHLLEVLDLVHGCGGLVYGDGANMNALLGIAQPGAMGFDVLHYNLHKTFSTPHGGGGPGSGPVGCSAALAPYLPGPIVRRELLGECPEEEHEHDEDCYYYDWHMPECSIGRVKTFYGHFGVMVRAYTYIRMLGAAGLRQVGETAVLNANYLQQKIKEHFALSHERICMHEFVCVGRVEGSDVRALDISKRLIDYGFHPPTNYFPLIVPEALMIEPTETESQEMLDAFAEAMARIAEESRTQPELLHEAPHTAPMRRLDEVRAARDLVLRWEGEE